MHFPSQELTCFLAGPVERYIITAFKVGGKMHFRERRGPAGRNVWLAYKLLIMVRRLLLVFALALSSSMHSNSSRKDHFSWHSGPGLCPGSQGTGSAVQGQWCRTRQKVWLMSIATSQACRTPKLLHSVSLDPASCIDCFWRYLHIYHSLALTTV